MHFDIFNDDAFSVSQLSRGVVDMPHTPTRVGDLNLFSEEPISTTSVTIESVGSTIALVAAGQRGTPAKPVTGDKRKLRSFQCVHLPQRGAVVADEVQNLRAFGSETEVETALAVVNKKLLKMKRNIDATLEWQRLGAIKGQVLDADGTSVLLDLFQDFGVAQIVKAMGLDTTTTDVKQKCVELKRSIEDELGGLSHTGVRVLCSAGFFDKLVGHASVKKAYDLWKNGEFLRTDQARTGMTPGFYFGEIFWEEYRGKVNGQAFIADGEAYAIPEGVPDLFVAHFAPADYMETVNTLGLPYYAKQWAMEGNKGIVLESQSNPLHLCTRPRTVHKLTAP